MVCVVGSGGFVRDTEEGSSDEILLAEFAVGVWSATGGGWSIRVFLFGSQPNRGNLRGLEEGNGTRQLSFLDELSVEVAEGGES